MKFFKKSRKGFTLVELIVVIAIVAILAAVSVVSYIAFINKGNESADIQLVKQLNTCLQADEALNGTRATPTEMLKVMDDNGFNIVNLTKTKSGQDIVWDQKNNRFALLNNLNKVYGEASYDSKLNYQTWFFIDTMAEFNTLNDLHYATYLTKEFGNADALTVYAGIDVGKNTVGSIDYLNYPELKNSNNENIYVGPQTVVIRTSNGNLTVNGPQDIVHHYSYIDNLTVERIKGESYHEHGTVAVKMEVQDGHVVVEDTGSVNELSIPETTGTNSVSVALKSNATVSTLVVDDEEATVGVESGAEVGQVVGETENISGAGAEEIKVKAIEKTFVTDNASLKLAINQEKKYIVFSNDITVENEPVDFEYEFTLDGAGYTLTTAKGILRGVNVGASGNVKNLTVDCKNMKASGDNYPRGINVYGDNANAVIDNVKVFNVSHYALNVPSIESPTISVSNSELIGYAALNLWASNYTVNVSNSILKGINNSSNSSSSFSTICLEGDTTNKTTLHSSLVDVRIANSSIYAVANGTCSQVAIGFNSHSVSNTVSLIGTKVILDDSGLTFVYRDDGEGNKLFIDNEQVNVPKVKNCWYSNGAFTPDRSAPSGMSTRFEIPFEQNWLWDGEGIILDMDIQLEGNLTYKANGTIYIYLNGHTITGGQIVLSSGVRVVMDEGNCSNLFTGGTISITNNQDGTFTYTCE